jgi:hypothetical protein
MTSLVPHRLHPPSPRRIVQKDDGVATSEEHG